MAFATHIMKGIEIAVHSSSHIGMEFLGGNIIAAAMAAFAMMAAFSYFIFHQTTYKEEKVFLKEQISPELESVESSQERRSKKEREEEQSIEDVDSEEEEERPTKRPRLAEPTVAELVLEQLEDYDQRVHLVTFAATDAEAEFIFKYVPKARYLISLDAEEHHDHVTEVRYARLRSFSAPADLLA